LKENTVYAKGNGIFLTYPSVQNTLHFHTAVHYYTWKR